MLASVTGNAEFVSTGVGNSSPENSKVENIRLEVTTANCFASVPADRWRGEYYNNTNLSGSAAMVRDDGDGFLNLDFGAGSPSSACGLGVDNFSARWTRTANFAPGLYRFTVTGDDGVRLYVDGQLRLDKWVIQAATYTVDVGLSAGNHEVKLEYFENGGNAVAAVSWANIGSNTDPAITGVSSSAVTLNSATISWATNEPADSQVEYGTTTAYGQSTTLNPSLVTAHSQMLSGLTAGTQYYYRVKSRDAAGNLAISDDFSFTTTQSGSIPLDGLASLSYDPTNNRITTPGNEYDPAGILIRSSGTQQQYRYDCAGRLAQVLDGNGTVLASYSYGASNQRLMSVEGGVTKYFAWAGGKIIAEYEAFGANALQWKMSYVYLGGNLLATTSGSSGTETRFHHPDRLGMRLVTDSLGDVVSEQLNLPFGTMLPFTQTYGGENSYQHPTLSNPSKKRFTTYDRSDMTGLDYAVNRFYSAQQGRFTQVDPIGMSAVSLSNPQTLNMYAYCGNDPINHTDPDGLFFDKICNVLKAIASAFKSIFSSSIGGFSGPGFQTPPTFPGSLPGITAATRSGLGGFRTPPFVSGFLGGLQQTTDDSWGTWWERLGNWISRKGWKTNREVEIDNLRAFEAKRREAYAWLKAHGATDEELGKLTAQQQIDVYEAAKRGESSVTSGESVININPGAPALTGNPLPEVNKAVNSNLPHAAKRAAERGIFPDEKTAAEGLRNLSDEITQQKAWPTGTIPDTAHADRVLVPVGKGGYAVYQVLKNKTARLWTVLIAK